MVSDSGGPPCPHLMLSVVAEGEMGGRAGRTGDVGAAPRIGPRLVASNTVCSVRACYAGRSRSSAWTPEMHEGVRRF